MGVTNEILKNRLKSIMEFLNIDANDVVVLKGLPLNAVLPEYKPVNLDEIIKNKLGYFMKVFSDRRFLSYEEFLLLNSFVIDQYQKVYVINNNLYINMYPIDAELSAEDKNGLITHFSESENDYDDTPIGNIDELIDLFYGVKDVDGRLYGAYCTDKIIDNIKLQTINLFENEALPFRMVEWSDQLDVMDINEESDYTRLVEKILNGAEKVYIRTTNYVGDVERLNDHIAMLRSCFATFSSIVYIQPQKLDDVFERREEYTDILQRYWGHDEFRFFDVYDQKALEEGKKNVVQVSQEQIIADLVQQAENCADPNKECRDVFVTAPTGAGKSVIFQIPAIYLAEKYHLLTIVISPLIGLMNDQINNLEKKNYRGAKTINSDISPIVREDILQKVSEGELHILYLSPETLLARSSVEQLIGDRTIGMIIIDEAHIVTTWGKQFRPDYWYLGDHIRKLRSNQVKKKGRSFVIGTFTATAIYHGIEDMYEETKESLHMIDPITYLGYVKRNDISIVIDTSTKGKDEKTEYEIDKLDDIVNVVTRAKITQKKTLIYFPTISLIEGCWQYLENKRMTDCVTKYYGPLPKDRKNENYHSFYSGEKLVMLATKAFGMGIDIDNIELVVHFAPTGNVCDYVQEIGRAARRMNLSGEAYYHYNSRDFKYINRLHGLSTIKEYQLVEVIKKIDELFTMSLRKYSSGRMTKRRNAMLVDAENFKYIFDNPIGDADDSINKVKTALLIIQKDFESKIGFSPIAVRPIPMFSIGFFEVDPSTQKKLNRAYDDCLEEVDQDRHICRVLLEKIWNTDYKSISFPQFKYEVYSRDPEFKFNRFYSLTPALCVAVEFADDFTSAFRNVWNAFKKIAHDGIVSMKYIPVDEIVQILHEKCSVSVYKAQTICEVVLSSMELYRRNYSHGMNSMFMRKELQSGEIKYQFKTPINSFFSWVEKGFGRIQEEAKDGSLYVVNRGDGQSGREISTILGILESINVLKFEMSGGAGNQLYIYVNQIRNLKNICNNPKSYSNRLLQTVAERHLISVQMLKYIYESGFSNEEIWNLIENYFLGMIPERVKENCLRENPRLVFDK